MKKLVGRILRKASAAIAVEQLEQWDNAFKNSGQPSAKWKPLWANDFEGKISEKHLLGLGSAAMGISHAEKQLKDAKEQEESLKRAGKKKKGTAVKIAAKSLKKMELQYKKSAALAVAATSYRKGGKPLNDDGILRASRQIKYNLVFESEGAAIICLSSNAIYANWQQNGFKTKGPNFIPLTKAARLRHVLHQNPAWEDLEEGVDYIMAWKGVNVPARPIIDYSDPVNKKKFEDVIRHSMTAKG